MSGRTSLSSDPQEHYALNILTQAAMHTRHAANGSGFARREGNSNTMITNHHHHQNGHHSVMDEYNASMLSSRDLDQLAFNSPPQDPSEHAYLNETYGVIDGQLTMSHANNLRILNAESYDDSGRTPGSERSKNSKHILPFGISDHPRVTLDPPLHAAPEDHDSGPRRKKPRIETKSQDGEEGTKGKSRGRPRVSPKDETAADRRRTQIRMAQRAYRHRKESTISTLEKKVQDLTGTNEEMSSIFINLYDFAVRKGLLQREPEFGQQLQATTEKFLALAKASADEDHDENQDDSSKNSEVDSGRSNSQKSSRKRNQEIPLPVSEPLVSEPAPAAFGGYIIAKDESPEMDATFEHDDQYRDSQYKPNRYRARPSDIQVITRPTEDNASFPFDFMDLQQYRVEVPPMEEFSQHLLSESHLPLPKTFANNELSLSRRIHRLAIERAFRLITSEDPAAEARIQHVFRFSLMYNTRQDIIARFHRLLRTSGKDTLQNWRAPFVNIGGAGTHYPMLVSDENWELRPKFSTGYSMGPFSSAVTGAQELLDDDMKISLPGFEGYFFDPNDVEGYLRGRGLDIAPNADFVEIELDILGISDPSSPKSTSSDSVTSKNSPRTPKSTVEAAAVDAGKAFDALGIDLVDGSFRDADPASQYLPFPLGFTNWEDVNSAKVTGDFVNDLFKQDQSAKSGPLEMSPKARRSKNGRTVTIDVNVLIYEIIIRGVCLDRSPGFKPSDVDAALIEAVKVGTSVAY